MPRLMEKPMWPNKSLSNAAASLVRAASISGNTNGWQRIAPWPKIMRFRVRIFAPSTVIATGQAAYAVAKLLRGPRAPLPPPPRWPAGASFPPLCFFYSLPHHLRHVVLGDRGHHRRRAVVH